MKVFAYSKALYSTWLYLEPMRLLLDAGEGVNCALEGRLLAFRDLAITHAHTDHFTGLQNILITRLRELDVQKDAMPPLNIYYPHDSGTLDRYFQYLKDTITRWDELAILHPLAPGDKVALTGARNIHMTALKADHQVYGQTALSYRIEEKRWVLKDDIAGKPQPEINKLIAEKGRDAITKTLMRPLVYYSGDGRPQLDEDSRGAQLHIQEATFLEAPPRVDHTELKDAIELFYELGGKYLLLYHLSSRSCVKEYLAAIKKFIPRQEDLEKIWVVKPGNVFIKDIPMPGF